MRGTATRPENSPRDTAAGEVMPSIPAQTLIASKSKVRHTVASFEAMFPSVVIELAEDLAQVVLHGARGAADRVVMR